MRTILVKLFSCIVFISCSTERLVTKYYLIETSSVINDNISADMQHDFPIKNFSSEIRKFTVSKPYDQDRIVLRTKSNEINYYYYHKWAETPSTSITFFVRNKIKEANFFSAFDFLLYDVPVNFVVIGTVNQIERVDINGNSSAHLNMKLELLKKETGQAVAVHAFDRYSPIEQYASMNLFAQEINQILNDETDVFIKKIFSYIERSND